MAKGYKHGTSGGAAPAENPLNFTVLGGTTEPTAPTENTLWVNTPIDITGYYFSATQPENMANCEVWFTTGDDSAVAFNALKDNCIQVYPSKAMQMVNGALVDVTAKTYQNGAWVEWFSGVYFVEAGNPMGTLKTARISAPDITVTPSLEEGVYLLNLKSTSSGYGGEILLYFEEYSLYDISNISTIILRANASGRSNNELYNLVVRTSEKSSDVAVAELTAGFNDISLDVSSLTGNHLVGIFAKDTYGSSLGISDFYME